ncbi:hypothetical protein JM654_18180 [Microbacterium oxydans]|nr:hypothetical protein [Microbacterium oxydans]
MLGAFVAGLGSAAHGRQIVISFAWARHLATAPVDVDGLPDCGLAQGRERLMRRDRGAAANRARLGVERTAARYLLTSRPLP